MTKIRVQPAAPPSADYVVDLRPGVLAELGDIVRRTAPAHRHAVLADANVIDTHGRRALESLALAGHTAQLFPVPAGEENKTRETWAALSDMLVEAGFGRDTALVAVGGGVTGDIVGFVAATFMRGVPVVQVPTTLLAMVDACIGGKTGVDTGRGKNLIGAFHQPRAVVMDPEILATLPAEHLRSGIAETVKHGAIADAAYLRWMHESASAILACDMDALALLVRRSVEVKASFVNIDPFEAGPRKALNFGHTIAHALEAETSYSMLHGDAVAIGCVVEALMGESIGVTQVGTALRLSTIFSEFGLPTRVPAGMNARRIIERTRFDKKVRGATVRYSLIAAIGSFARADRHEWTHPVSDREAHEALISNSA